MEPNLDELIGKRRTNTKHASDASRAEAQKRRELARDMAKQATLNLHREDYEALYQQAKAKVAAMRGPLPD